MDRGTHRPAGSLLCCSYEFPPLGGGGSRVVEGLTRQLSDLGVGVDIVTMGAAGLPPFEQIGSIRLHRISGIRRRPEICHPHEMAWHLIRAQPYIRRLVDRTRFDVNHTHFIFPDGLLAWRLKQATGLRYIVTAHGSDVPGYNPDRFVGLHRLTGPMWQRVVDAAEAIVCPSRHLERLVHARAPGAKTMVIPNGIDVDRFTTNRPRQPAMLVVARLVDRKGVQHLLEAVRERAYPWTVHIVGDGPARAKLELLAQASRTPIRFWGWLDNGSTQLRNLFETSRIFVYPSSDENFPIALLEAMAAGLAIVTTRGTGCAEVVADKALLVGAADPGELRGALDRLTSDPDLCRSLSAAARARVDQLFSWRAVAARYRTVLAAAGRS